MKKIQMVDLKSQYEKIKGEIDTAIHEVIDSTAFINGPAVQQFQKDLESYLDVKHVIPCGNGTDALQKFIHAKDTGHPINAVILDFTIPGGMGGKETMKHLLELEPDIRGIISSGYADDPLMHDPQQFGFAGKLKKPYSKNDLADVLHNVLSIK